MTLIYLADLAHTHSVEDRSLTVPLGLGYIKAHARAAFGDSVEIRLFKHPERLLAAVAERPPEIVGLANYGWNASLNLTVGQWLRRELPEALIVAGGPNLDPEPALQLAFLERHDYLDLLIVEGGEEPFTEVLSWWLEGSNPDRRPGNLVWREDGKLHATEARPLTKTIENVPSPYLDGDLDEFLAAGMVPLFETNRGCPFRCTFCAWGMASKDLVRRFELDTALAEVAYVGERSDARNWIICDANFGILKRDVEIAKAIRAVRDRHGHPDKCHVWLAKNVTERNLEIGKILGDMTVPVMAVQSLDDEVLARIKRGNISTDTYVAYQKRFHEIGSRTYSDLIVPLPGETYESHVEAIRQLAAFGVDIIQNHNMRLLAGAETNSTETRETYGFQTRFRLIHGDAGAYRAPDGEVLRCFEFEESLRATTTITEEQMFELRKLHFLVDFCWNIDVYKPLLKVLQAYGGDPVAVMERLLEAPELADFWAMFDEASQAEWFDSEEDIRAYFAVPENFERLLNQEFEKLNIQFAVIALKAHKPAFDTAVRRIVETLGLVPEALLEATAGYTFAAFPPLDEAVAERRVALPANLGELSPESAAAFRPAEPCELRLVESPQRERLRKVLADSRGLTLSKVLNTQGIGLRDLKLTMPETFGFDDAFRRAI